MTKYKVLWFDDEHENFQSIKDEAILEDIQLIGFTNAKDGIPELINNFKEYDAVILDGLFFKTSSHTGTDIDQTAFGEVAVILKELKAQKIILPWFIFSGQKSFVKDKNDLVEILKDSAYASGKVFDKSKDEDFLELLREIKVSANNNPERRLRLNHPEVFQIFDAAILNDDVKDQVLNLFLQPLPQNRSELKAILTNIRSIQEAILVKLEGIKVLPKLPTFNQKVKHLSGNIAKGADGNYTARSVVFQTPEIENLQKWIYFTCSTYIHHLDAQHYNGYMISNYAVDSLRLGLMELLLWFKSIYIENTK